MLLKITYGLDVDWGSFGVLMHRLLFPGLRFSDDFEIEYKKAIQKNDVGAYIQSTIKKDLIARVRIENSLLYSFCPLNSVLFDQYCKFN